jgi:hypothetical protein
MTWSYNSPSETAYEISKLNPRLLDHTLKDVQYTGIESQPVPIPSSNLALLCSDPPNKTENFPAVTVPTERWFSLWKIKAAVET